MQSKPDLLAAYDAQVRTASSGREPAGVVIDWDGPLLRASGLSYRGFVGYRDLAGLAGPELDALIERTCRYFDERGETFEWKTHGHDQPADLTDRLRAAGFVAEDVENIFVGVATDLVEAPALDVGLRIEEVTEPAGFRLIGAMESEIWDEDWNWLADDMIARRAADPSGLSVFGAFAGDRLVSAAWLVANPGTEFAGLWGGSTLAGWRGRGIYRALVARRARLAVERGFRYLQVDASPDSTPILDRLGFVLVTTSTPYVHQPAAGCGPVTLNR